MHDTAGVRVMKSGCSLNDDAQPLQQTQRTAARDNSLQVLAIEQFHYEIRRTFVLAEIVDDDDVVVTELAGCRGFITEALQQLRIAAERQRFDRDQPADRRVVGAEYLAEAAAAQL